MHVRQLKCFILFLIIRSTEHNCPLDKHAVILVFHHLVDLVSIPIHLQLKLENIKRGDTGDKFFKDSRIAVYNKR